MPMRNNSSTVKIGWTTERSPNRNAVAWRTNWTNNSAKPSSQIPRLSALVKSRSFMASSAGARSTPIRWSTPATALHSAAAAARR